jgi:hypothetical protein
VNNYLIDYSMVCLLNFLYVDNMNSLTTTSNTHSSESIMIDYDIIIRNDKSQSMQHLLEQVDHVYFKHLQ